MTFPEDDVEVWKILLYWRINGDFPSRAVHRNNQLLVHCWVLADKYDIAEFQHLAMKHLIDGLCDSDYASMELTTVKLAFESTAPGSMLRQFMADWTVVLLLGKKITYDDLELCDGIAGFASAIARAYDRLWEHDHGFRDSMAGGKEDKVVGERR